MRSKDVRRRFQGTVRLDAGWRRAAALSLRRHAHLHRVLPLIVDQGNCLAILLDAVDCHPHHAALAAIPGPCLREVDVVDRFPVTVMDRQPAPVCGEAGREVQPVRFQSQAPHGFQGGGS